MKNNNLIIAALVVVVLILAGVVYQQSHPKTPGQEIADGVGRAVQSAGDSIQDAAH
jgi:predicted small secreted protein